MSRIRHLPSHWQQWLEENGPLYAGELFDSEGVTLKFEDESKVRFKWAFYVVNEDYREICVFTEHCG